MTVSSLRLRNDGSSSFGQSSHAPVGSSQPTWTFAGATLPSAFNGVLTLGDIPISSDTPFDFTYAFGSDVGIYHPTANLGNIPVGCDPAFDPQCTAALVPPVHYDGNTVSDFSNTLTFAGYQVFDANGNDITAAVQLSFASGLNIPAAGASVPEPGTIALLGCALAVLWRRRTA